MEASRIAIAAVGVLLLVTPAFASADAEAPAPIQPGAMHLTGGSACTLNFVFEDANGSGTLYIGTAGHCVEGVGERIEVPEHGEIGTVVYEGDTSPSVLGMGQGVEGHHEDFALIEIDDDRHGLVDPSVRHWGGPTAVAETFTPGEPILHYGNAKYVSATTVTRERVAQLVTVYDERSVSNGDDYEGWYLANGAFFSGDSGSPLLAGDGEALGIVSTMAVGVGEPGTDVGPTVDVILSNLAAAGFGVELRTAPLTVDGPAALAGASQAQVESCEANPIGDWTSEACVRDPDPWPARHTSVHAMDEGEDHAASSQEADETHTRFYNVANGATVRTSLGETGATTAATDSNQAPIFVDRAAAEVTIEADDLVSERVYLSVCLDTSASDDDFTANDLVCSGPDPDDTITRGFSGLTLKDVPAGTWIDAAPYGLYADDEGDVAFATDGKLRYAVTWEQP